MPPTISSASIEVESVSHSFAAGVRAIDNVSLHIDAGQFVSIVGPSGCGKTTLLNLLAGLVELQEGRILVAGADPRAGRHEVAYMLARDCLYPWRTALYNVMVAGEFRRVPMAARRKRAATLLGRVGLADFEKHYPKALSQGMRQRVALARTFSLDSPVLLMDEPFGALDAQTKLQLESVLLDLWSAEKRTVLFITHDLNEAVTMSDRVIVMSARPGRIIADIAITLPRPRSVKALQRDPRYHEIYSNVWTRLEEGLS